MREGWKFQKLADVCTLFTDGNWIETKDQSPDGIRLIQTGNVGFGIFKNRIDKARYINQEKFDQLKCQEIFEGDYLVSRLPDPVGRACLIPDTGKRMITAVDCTILRFEQSIINPKYFEYFSQSMTYLDEIDSACTGATRKRISRKNLGKVIIPLPPLPEQKRIVAILDEAFEKIAKTTANAEKNLANARELFESYLASQFGNPQANWPSKTLKEVSVEFGRGKSKHRPRNDPSLYGGPYPFIQTGDVRNSEHVIENFTQTYNENGLAQSKLWPKGTICITIAANIAETGVLNFNACFPDSIIGIVVDGEQASNDYVEYLLQSMKIVIKAKGKGSAQDNINLATFKNEYFPFPDLPEQLDVVGKLNQLSSHTILLEQFYEKRLSTLSELKQSILQKAFSGELTKDAIPTMKEAAA